MEKSIQIFRKTKYQEKVLNVFFLSVILIDFVFRIGNNYHPQVFFKEFKYAFKENKMPEYITNDIEISSDE